MRAPQRHAVTRGAHAAAAKRAILRATTGGEPAFARGANAEPDERHVVSSARAYPPGFPAARTHPTVRAKSRHAVRAKPRRAHRAEPCRAAFVPACLVGRR